ncbi:MAG: DHH family phosphoesterase [Candidatus Caldarchaeum sp.]
MRDLRMMKELHRALVDLTRLKRVQILSHWGGDADSVGSSYVLSRLLTNNYESLETGFMIPEEKSSHVEAIMNYLGMGERRLSRPDVYLLVDVGSLNQLGSLQDAVLSSGSKMITIDHHLTDGEDRQDLCFASPNYLATAEIVYDLMEYLGMDVSGKEAEALFLGIYYDTVRLSVADRELSGKAAKLLKAVDPSKLIGLLEPSMEEAERIARLKALRRTVVYRLGEWYLAVSSVSAYLSPVARVLINSGAHVAVVSSYQNGVCVLSMRSSYDFQKYTNVSLGGDLVKHLLRRFEGQGGGHAGAARINLRTTPEEAVYEVVKTLSTLLGVNAVELAD